jgi:hypothetical protein
MGSKILIFVLALCIAFPFGNMGINSEEKKLLGEYLSIGQDGSQKYPRVTDKDILFFEKVDIYQNLKLYNYKTGLTQTVYGCDNCLIDKGLQRTGISGKYVFYTTTRELNTTYLSVLNTETMETRQILKSNNYINTSISGQYLCCSYTSEDGKGIIEKINLNTWNRFVLEKPQYPTFFTFEYPNIVYLEVKTDKKLNTYSSKLFLLSAHNAKKETILENVSAYALQNGFVFYTKYGSGKFYSYEITAKKESLINDFGDSFQLELVSSANQRILAINAIFFDKKTNKAERLDLYAFDIQNGKLWKIDSTTSTDRKPFVQDCSFTNSLVYTVSAKNIYESRCEVILCRFKNDGFVKFIIASDEQGAANYRYYASIADGIVCWMSEFNSPATNVIAFKYSGELSINELKKVDKIDEILTTNGYITNPVVCGNKLFYKLSDALYSYDINTSIKTSLDSGNLENLCFQSHKSDVFYYLKDGKIIKINPENNQKISVDSFDKSITHACASRNWMLYEVNNRDSWGLWLVNLTPYAKAECIVKGKPLKFQPHQGLRNNFFSSHNDLFAYIEPVINDQNNKNKAGDLGKLVLLDPATKKKEYIGEEGTYKSYPRFFGDYLFYLDYGKNQNSATETTVCVYDLKLQNTSKIKKFGIFSQVVFLVNHKNEPIFSALEYGGEFKFYYYNLAKKELKTILRIKTEEMQYYRNAFLSDGNDIYFSFYDGKLRQSILYSFKINQSDLCQIEQRYVSKGEITNIDIKDSNLFICNLLYEGNKNVVSLFKINLKEQSK